MYVIFLHTWRTKIIIIFYIILQFIIVLVRWMCKKMVCLISAIFCQGAANILHVTSIKRGDQVIHMDYYSLQTK